MCLNHPDQWLGTLVQESSCLHQQMTLWTWVLESATHQTKEILVSICCPIPPPPPFSSAGAPSLKIPLIPLQCLHPKGLPWDMPPSTLKKKKTNVNVRSILSRDLGYCLDLAWIQQWNNYVQDVFCFVFPLNHVDNVTLRPLAHSSQNHKGMLCTLVHLHGRLSSTPIRIWNSLSESMADSNDLSIFPRYS